jgi:branched-chain amino acid transport system ATP-binding protein
MALLQIENLNAFYGAAQILWDIALEVDHHEIVSLIGANGAGKTTLMRSISGLVAKTAGSIFYQKEDILHLDPDKIVLKGIAQVPEGRRLFSGMTVRENLLMGAYLRSSKAEIHRDLERVYGYFPRLLERKDQIAGKLSGGEQQMCAIGRALMSAPKVLLIDELSLGLAPLVIDELLEIIKRLRQENMSILLVEQDVQTGLDVSDRAYVLEHGRVVMHGASSVLQNNPQIRESYLGV